MKILIDIGNTNTSIGVLDGKRITERYFIHTSKRVISVPSFDRLLGKYLKRVDEVVIVSVVPRFLKILKGVMGKIAPRVRVTVAGENKRVPIVNHYSKPRQVGQDRLVTAYAAACLYKCPLVVIDFGTAVTMDYVNAKGEYEGGVIFPGMRLALGSLVKNTALLPAIALKPTSGLIGKDTRGSMNNGILYGYSAFCDGLIERFRDEFGKNVFIVATGGDAKLVARYSKHLRKIAPDLIFEGLKRMASGQIFN
jgi:type III pantothenate kinase